MAENKLFNGIRLFPKKDNQPDFVIASGVVTLSEIQKFFEDNKELCTEYNGAKQLKIQVLKSKDGKPYISLDTFKPSNQQQQQSVEPDYSKDLPF